MNKIKKNMQLDEKKRIMLNPNHIQFSKHMYSYNIFDPLIQCDVRHIFHFGFGLHIEIRQKT